MIGGQTTAAAVYSYGVRPLHMKFMVSIAIHEPHSSTLPPGHTIVQLVDGTRVAAHGLPPVLDAC